MQETPSDYLASKMKFDGLKEAVEQADIITIYRHSHPDCDAVGAQFGLKQWILDNWPNKHVYALGNDSCSQGVWPKSDVCDDSTVIKSLAIVVDTANQERIDDQRYRTAAKLIKIDHHPDREPYGALSYVYDKAAAACEILAEFFSQNPDCTISLKTAEDLYCGILTDTLRFGTSNTTAHTLEMAAYLAEKGVHIPELNRALFDQDLASFRFAGYVRSHVVMDGAHLAYLVLTTEEEERWHISDSRARNFIDEIGHVQDFEIWAIFTEKITEDGVHLYDGSLRSKTIVINDLAEQYHGGGHKNACGVKNLTQQDVKTLLSQLSKKIEKTR